MMAEARAYRRELLERVNNALFHFVKVVTPTSEAMGCLTRYRAYYNEEEDMLVFVYMILRTSKGTEILVTEAPTLIEKYNSCLEDEGDSHA